MCLVGGRRAHIRKISRSFVLRQVRVDSGLIRTKDAQPPLRINSDAFASEAPSPSFFTYFWPTNSRPSTSLEKLVLLESRTTIEAGTTGLRTWRASLMLGEWLLEHPGTLLQESQYRRSLTEDDWIQRL